MTKRLPPATLPLPKFRSDEAAAKYFETHSMADVWNGLPESTPGKPSKALAEIIRKRHAASKPIVNRRP